MLLCANLSLAADFWGVGDSKGSSHFTEEGLLVVGAVGAYQLTQPLEMGVPMGKGDLRGAPIALTAPRLYEAAVAPHA